VNVLRDIAREPSVELFLASSFVFRGEIHSFILFDKVLDHILDEFDLQLRLIFIVLRFHRFNCWLIRFLCLFCRLVYIALFYRVDF